MPYTVNTSFDAYRSSTVDLDPNDVAIARKSRDYLVDQIKTVADKDASFPKTNGNNKAYGSFARSTKVRPLDD